MDEHTVPASTFEQIVSDAVEALPDWVAPLVNEIALIVEDRPAAGVAPGSLLLGTFRGVPRTSYGGRPPGSLPATITLYRIPILATCSDPSEVPDRVLKVLGHEIGHSLGLSEERLRELGWY